MAQKKNRIEQNIKTKGKIAKPKHQKQQNNCSLVGKPKKGKKQPTTGDTAAEAEQRPQVKEIDQEMFRLNTQAQISLILFNFKISQYE